MIEAYLAYSLIPLFFIILAAVIYFALIRPSISRSAIAQEAETVQQASTPPTQSAQQASTAPTQPDAANMVDRT